MPAVLDLAVQAEGLVKRFGGFTAVDGLKMSIPKGAFYAFLGPNGAGKSTTISLMTSIYAPDAGSMQILGVDAIAHPLKVKSRIGVVPEELSLFERLTARQYLTFCGRMHGLSGDDLADHTIHAYWLGNEWPLKLEMFRR